MWITLEVMKLLRMTRYGRIGDIAITYLSFWLGQNPLFDDDWMLVKPA